jgi:hypothetical protein
MVRDKKKKLFQYDSNACQGDTHLPFPEYIY